MRIFTSYYAKVKKMNLEKFLPIAISRKVVNGWSFPKIPELAPTQDILNEIKYRGGTKENYKERYLKEVLGKYNSFHMLKFFERISRKFDNKDLVFCCYEKPEDFCHRHILAEWLDPNIKEWEEEDNGLD